MEAMPATIMCRRGGECRRYGTPSSWGVVLGWFVFALLLGAVGVGGELVNIKPNLNAWSTIRDTKLHSYQLSCDPNKYLFINSLVWATKTAAQEVMGKANKACAANRNSCLVDFKNASFKPKLVPPADAKRTMGVSCMDHVRLTAVEFDTEMELKCTTVETLRINNATLITTWSNPTNLTDKVMSECAHRQECKFKVDKDFTGVTVDSATDASFLVAYDCVDGCTGTDCGPQASCKINKLPKCQCQFAKSAIWGKKCKELKCSSIPCTPYGDCSEGARGHFCNCGKNFQEGLTKCEYLPHLPCLRSRTDDTCPANSLCHHTGVGATGAQCTCPPGHYWENNKCEKGTPLSPEIKP